MTPRPAQAPHHPALVILILSLGGAVGLGICRFAYALVLPDMRADLGWNYAEAGFMNTVNAAGYLAGAMAASAAIRRIGLFGAVVWGTLICVAALFASGGSGNFVVLSAARALAGFGAALAFVGGGTLAARIAQVDARRSSLLLGLFYTGPSTGIMVSGLLTPALLERLGPGSWWIIWLVLAAISAAACALLPFARTATAQPAADAPASAVRMAPFLPILTSYFLFGAGYIAYMTFMIAWVRDAGGGALAQSVFWCLIGVGAFASPWTWSGMLGRVRSGRGTALLNAVTVIGAVLPLIDTSPLMLGLSAMVFGNAFFAVVTSTTAFIRHNFAFEAWPKAIAIMTIAFSIGQTLGPVLIGAITDAVGSLSAALMVSAAMLGAGVIAAAFQRALRSDPAV
ncbi:MAG: YbfB/YjiJ family MFS transporter [Xanthobacteraceae bacterium]|nr:MAG: YbfB/YjiJ family MFS transporter [Xanthobacteraceae bacterium]